jgi:hypothetical protein
VSGRAYTLPISRPDAAHLGEKSGLSEGQAAALDCAHLAEEIDCLGRSQKRKIRNRLAVLLAHLLKRQYRPDKRNYGWRVTITEQRDGILGVIEDSPSLREEPLAMLAKAYAVAIGKAALDTDLPPETFPVACPYTADEVLDPTFYPGPPGGPA